MPPLRAPAIRQAENTRMAFAGTEAHSQDQPSIAHEGGAPAPLRRRSWQQIGRAREIEDARTAQIERESDPETFPAPRNIVQRV